MMRDVLDNIALVKQSVTSIDSDTNYSIISRLSQSVTSIDIEYCVP